MSNIFGIDFKVDNFVYNFEESLKNTKPKREEIKIDVPPGIRFLGDWSEFRFNKFYPKCIINKQIPGCGFTEYCINGPENVILASPRKMLLENKYNQHKGEVYLVVNEMDKDTGVDKDLDNNGKDYSKSVTEEELIKKKKEEDTRRSLIYQRIYQEISNYTNSMIFSGRPVKILVTYDSYHMVKSILESIGLFHRFYTVIDEFQSILHDSRFKSDTEMQFMEVLKSSHSALFVSATPMMEDYLNMLEDFDGLPYYTLDWGSLDPSRIIKPRLDPKTMKSVGTKAKEIIQTYLDGKFEEIVVTRGGVPVKVVSDEAVFYVNSVNHIISIIKSCGLKPEQVNILCSKNDENQKKIHKKLGKKFNIGEVPLKGEKPKMFTFCTRTVYLGADFYSLCARSFVFSDSNIDSLAVDVSEDLPQIMGRQRLEENPWSNSVNFYYKTTYDYRKIDQKVFQELMDKKKGVTENLLLSYQTSPTISSKFDLAKTYKYVAERGNYKDNYVGVNVTYNPDGSRELMPKLNEYVLVNELRAFKIQQLDYADRITLFSRINEEITRDSVLNQKVINFFKEYDNLVTKVDKLRYLCESGLSSNEIDSILSQLPDSDEIKSFYIILGPSRLKSLGYNVTKIKKELSVIVFNSDTLRTRIYQDFKEGDKLALSDIKSRLASIYSELNYSKTPKAVDILDYFEVKEYMIRSIVDSEKKRIRMYELLKKK